MANVLNRLEKEYEENLDKIYDLEYKAQILRANTLNNKIINSLGFAVVTWAPCVFSTFALVHTNMPLELVCPLCVAIPATASIVGGTIINKVYKHKDKLKEISNAKTDNEILKERVECEIEKDKLLAQKTIIKRVYKELESNKNKNSVVLPCINKKEIQRKTNELKTDLETGKNKINTLVTKRYLADEFWNIRSKFNRVESVTTHTLVGSLCGLLVYNVPKVVICSQVPDFKASIPSIIIPTAVGGLTLGAYSIIQQNKKYKVFRDINNSLGKDKLSDVRNDNDLLIIDDLLFSEKDKYVENQIVYEYANIVSSDDTINYENLINLNDEKQKTL